MTGAADRQSNTLSGDDFVFSSNASATVHPTTAAFVPEAMADAHPAFAAGLHIMEHLAIA